MGARDPLHDLGALWARLEAPEAAEADDASTRAAVEWMRAGWASLEPDPGRLARSRPRRPGGSRFRRVGAHLAGSAFAAAALVLVLSLPRDPRRPAPAPPGGARAEAPGPERVPERPLSSMRSHAAPLPPYTPNSLERRHGSVRLIFLDGPMEAAPGGANTHPSMDPDRLPAGTDR